MQTAITATQILTGTVAVAAGIAAVGAAVKVVRGIVSAAFDRAVWGAVQRNAPALEEHMRQQVFAGELHSAVETRQLALRAVQICESNASAIAALVDSHGQLSGQIAELPKVSAAIEHVAAQMENMNTKLDRVGSQVDYVHGVMDAIRGGGVAIPPSAHIPVGRT